MCLQLIELVRGDTPGVAADLFLDVVQCWCPWRRYSSCPDRISFDLHFLIILLLRVLRFAFAML